MQRMRREFLGHEHGLVTRDGIPFDGVMFTVGTDGAVLAQHVACGVIGAPYAPSSLAPTHAHVAIDISDYLHASEQCVDLPFTRHAIAFSGAAYGFDEQGYCYRELLYENGTWTVDARWDYRGQTLLEANDQGDFLRTSWHDNGRVSLISIDTQNDGDASLALTAEGLVSSLRMNGGIFVHLSRRFPDGAFFPLRGPGDISAYACAERLIMSGDLVDMRVLAVLNQKSAFALTRELSLRDLALTCDALSVLVAMPALRKLVIESAREEQRAIASSLKAARPGVEVKFHRKLAGKAATVERL